MALLVLLGLLFRDDGRLRLSFEPIAELPFSLVTGIEFLPNGSDEFLIVDRDGGFAHMRLASENVELLTQGHIDGLYIEHAGATGILALSLDPDFENNHFFFVAVTLARDRAAVHRYTLHEDAAMTLASAVTILDIKARGAPRWHNIMAMGFDETGLMWVMVGDKGLFDPAQAANSFLGSMLRIAPSKEEGKGGYSVPGERRYFAGGHPGVFTIGIRSPWRAAYSDGRWFFGDVGDRVEEINVIDRPGMNLGWPNVEGPCQKDPEWTGTCHEYTDPWESYSRSSSDRFVIDDPDAVPTTSRSVYVGWVYRRTEADPYAERFNDVVTFGDTYVGFVRGKRIDSDGPSWHAGHLEWASAWAQGPDGYVYVTTLGEWPPARNGRGKASQLFRALLDD